jgi:hypothetical protein
MPDGEDDDEGDEPEDIKTNKIFGNLYWSIVIL